MYISDVCILLYLVSLKNIIVFCILYVDTLFEVSCPALAVVYSLLIPTSGLCVCCKIIATVNNLLYLTVIS